MRILINALGAVMGGGLRHLTNFLPALANSPGPHTYEVLMRSSIPAPCNSDRIKLTRWDDSRAASSIHRGFADLVTSSFHARHHDVLVSLMNFGPVLCPIPHVLFQCNALYYSEHYRSSLDTSTRLEIALRRRWTIESMRFAQVIVTPTHSMTDLIRQDCPSLSRAKFHTLYHGFDVATLCPTDDDHSKYPVNGNPVLLYSAHLGRYKNFEVILKALQYLKKSGFANIRLVLTFGPSDHRANFEYYQRMAREMDVEENVVFTGRIGQQQMGSLYRSADVFLFPSLCESFGFPLLEAMGSGVPIVASDIPSNRELCGQSALYFDTGDAVTCADRIRSVLDDKSRGSLLAAQGKKILQDYDWGWQRYAKEFIAMVERAAISKAA